jgi:hypothetical protein
MWLSSCHCPVPGSRHKAQEVTDKNALKASIYNLFELCAPNYLLEYIKIITSACECKTEYKKLLEGSQTSINFIQVPVFLTV